jgi:hypothetical protein
VNEALEMVDEIAVSALVKAQDPIELSNPGKARTRWRRYPWCQATPVAVTIQTSRQGSYTTKRRIEWQPECDGEQARLQEEVS